MKTEGSDSEREGISTAETERTSARVSLVLPLTETTTQDLETLFEEVAGVAGADDHDYEMVVVAEPPFLDVLDELEPLVEDHPISIRLVRSGLAVGMAKLVKLGAQLTDAQIVATLRPGRPGQMEVVSRAVRRILEGADVVYARDRTTRDPWHHRVLYRTFEYVMKLGTEADLPPVNGGVRAMRLEVLESIPLFSNSFRFIPVLARRDGFVVEEIDVSNASIDDPFDRGASSESFLQTAFDLIRLFFLTRFTWKPLRFFGLVGSAFAFPGLVILAVVFFQRIGGKGIANRPILLLGVLLVSLGIQAIAIGLVGELIVHLNAPEHRRYRVRHISGTNVSESSDRDADDGPQSVCGQSSTEHLDSKEG